MKRKFEINDIVVTHIPNNPFDNHRAKIVDWIKSAGGFFYSIKFLDTSFGPITVRENEIRIDISQKIQDFIEIL